MEKIKKKWRTIPITVKASIAYTICSILQKCLSFITLPLFTRLLTTEEYGQYTIYQSWFGILSMCLTLNLAYGSFSKAMIKYENDRDGYISSVEGICIFLSILFLLIYLPFRNVFNLLFELPTFIMVLMVIELLCSTGFQLWTGKKRFEYKYKLNILITIFISISSPCLAYYLVKTSTDKGYARIFGYALIICFVGGCFFIWNAVRGKKLFHKPYWEYALGFNLPLFAYYFSQVIFNQSDRIMISHFLGKDKAAIYGVAYSLAMILTFVLNAVNNSYVPWFFQKMKDQRQEDNQIVSTLISVMMATLLLGIIWFAPEIISILAGEKYAEAIYVVPPVAISLLLLFYSQIFIDVEFYHEEKGKLVFSSIGAALANILLNWIFIPKYGYVTAAYTTLVSYLLFAICNYFSMKQILRKKGLKDNAFDYKKLIIILLLLSVFSIVGVCLYGNVLIRLFCFIICLLVLLMNYKKILNCYVSLLKNDWKGQCKK